MRVRIRRAPVATFIRSLRQLDELYAELRIVDAAAERTDSTLPPAAVDAAEVLSSTYAAERPDFWEAVLDASAAGHETIDLEFDVPRQGGVATRRASDVIARCDSLCRDGDLLTLPADDEVTEFRQWFAAEIQRQLAGHEPVPYELWNAVQSTLTTSSAGAAG